MSTKLEVNQGLLDAALELAAERANVLREIKYLLLKGDDKKALRLLKKHLGIESLKLVSSK